LELKSACYCKIVKPDIAAPGVGVVSVNASSNYGYTDHFGTNVPREQVLEHQRHAVTGDMLVQSHELQQVYLSKNFISI
jgi:hypothetical protein